jgi:hypothetical protein
MSVVSVTTTRYESDSQYVRDTKLTRCFLQNNEFAPRTYKNLTGALASVPKFTMLGVVTATGMVVPCVSTATDGSQFPRFISNKDIVDAAINAEISISVCNTGLINRNAVKFASTEGWNTQIGYMDGQGTPAAVTPKVRMEELFIQNAQNARLTSITDLSEIRSV